MEITITFVATAIVLMRETESEEDFHDVLSVINSHLTNIAANVAIELDGIGKSQVYLDALDEHWVEAVTEMAQALREVRDAYVTGTGTLN